MFKDFFKRWREKQDEDALTHALYRMIVAQSRDVSFYRDRLIPDTPEGRYEVLVLHMWLVLRRFGSVSDAKAKTIAQSLFDLMFADMDINLRELGINDLAVGKRIRRMAEAFYGRVAAYDAGMEQGDAVLAAALDRNLFQRVADVPAEHLDWMVHYIRSQMEQLESLSDAAMIAGQIHFRKAETI